MRGNRWMILLVVAMLAVFAGTGQATPIVDPIWATNYASPTISLNPRKRSGHSRWEICHDRFFDFVFRHRFP